jgi:hypothetical protein
MMENVKEQRDKVQNKEELDIVDRVINDLGNEAKLQVEERLRELNKEIDDLKKDKYTSLINPKDRSVTRYGLTDKELFKFRILKRNDIKMVNDNQYQIIYNDEESKTDSDFEIEPNKPYYQDSEEFKKKKKLTKFLNKSKKVYINPDMSFISYRYKTDDKFYILVVNNVLENIEAYQLNSLNYLNKQHNVYYIIEANRDDRIKDLNSFKNYIIKACQKYANYNRTELYKVYETISPFKSEEAITKQYK